MVMKVIAAGIFKARCLRLMDEVQATRETLIITKKGKAVAKLVPADTSPKDIFGCMRGRMEIVGDILAPTSSPEDWEALR
jgi:prevent-host-death family protein